MEYYMSSHGAMSGKPIPRRNDLLAALSPEVQGRLYPHLKLVSLPQASVVCESNEPMRHVYFPAGAIISMQHLLKNGDSAGVMVIGHEGLLGLNFCLDSECTPSRSLVQSAGYAYRLPRRVVTREFNRHEEFMLLMLRSTQAHISQIAQTAVCNRRHSIDQQLCRWLLLSLDRLPDNRLTMTHEFIANMLGVRRESVTLAATKLRDLGLISYGRGLITVLDRPELERLSCECYELIRNACVRVLNYIPQHQTIKKHRAIPVVTVAHSHEAASRRAKRIPSADRLLILGRHKSISSL